MSAASGIEGRRILVVEDEYLIARDIARTLESLGCEVVGPVGSVREAMAQTRDGHFDGAILDINVGGEPVYPVADALAEEGVPVIFSTGYEGWVVEDRYRDAPRLQKPFTPHRLSAIITDLFGR